MKMRLVLLVAAVASDAMAQDDKVRIDPDMARCLAPASGGIRWLDATTNEPPRCVCPERHRVTNVRLVNRIVANDDCNRNDPACDVCIRITEISRKVRVVTRPGLERVVEKLSSCQQRCEGLGSDIATWVPDANENQRCQPVNAEQYAAGKCDIMPKPQVVTCQQRCEGLGSDIATWVPDANENQRCQPVDANAYKAGKCTILPKPQERVVERIVFERDTGMSLRMGAELYMGAIVGNKVYVPFGMGPGVRFQLGMNPDESVTLSGSVGLFISGKGGETPDVPTGMFGDITVHWDLHPYLGLGFGGHLHAVAMDKNLEPWMVETGAHMNIEFPFWSKMCRPYLGTGGGWVNPHEDVVWQGRAGIACLFPSTP